MRTILVIDDSKTECHAFKKMLANNGFHVMLAANGEQGLDMAELLQPDLILMDIVMPGIDGFQATRKLSNNPRTARIPVLIVSTKNQESDIIWGMRQGAKGYITKPVREKALVEQVNAALQLCGQQ